jgi:hypothetical protein
MTDRKQPSVAIFATVMLVAVLVLYPLSFGPACWIVDSGELKPWGSLRNTYWPIHQIVSRLPVIREAVCWWGDVGCPRRPAGSLFLRDTEGRLRTGEGLFLKRLPIPVDMDSRSPRMCYNVGIVSRIP